MKYSEKQISELRRLRLSELMRLALEAKLDNRGDQVSLCSIINAKSGKCSEDCRFCVQSGHYETDTLTYPLKDGQEIIEAARRAREIGAGHFSLGTSGKGLPAAEVEKVAVIIEEIRDKVGIRVCASLGILDENDFMILKQAGMSRYHHNLETSREYFAEVVSTHTFEDRVRTIAAAHKVGLEVCAGGIYGLGESEDDRVSMAMSLRELAVDSIPLNILIPLPGTPMEKNLQLSMHEILRAVALTRLINPTVPIRFAAGRETALTDFLGSAYMAGVDGMMIGGYLTQRGRTPEADLKFIEEMRRIWSE